MMMGGVIVPTKRWPSCAANIPALRKPEKFTGTYSGNRMCDQGSRRRPLDFPFHHRQLRSYLCWKLAKTAFVLSRQNEGFAGRKPIDPRDPDRRHCPIKFALQADLKIIYFFT